MALSVSTPAAKQKRSKLADTSSKALPTGPLGMAVVIVLNLFMALLSFRGISTPSLPAQGEQRRSFYFNIRRDIPDFDSEVTTTTGLPSGFTPASAATPTGFKGGGYLGCNYQAGALVFGVEGDVEGANVKGSTPFTNTGTPADFYETTINSQSSIRGRMGYAVDRALLYVT